MLMPTANSTTVPHRKPFCDCFHSIMPIRGNSISAMAAMVADEVSKLCSTFSVAQKSSSTSTMASSLHSFSVMAPMDSICSLMAALPPVISLISDRIICVTMKYNAKLKSAENGIPAINHSIQVMVV